MRSDRHRSMEMLPRIDRSPEGSLTRAREWDGKRRARRVTSPRPFRISAAAYAAPMNLAFDHAVVIVPDVTDAIRRFSEAGFHVVPGGHHDVTPTSNALIAFEDGSYLELLAPRDQGAGESLRVRAARRGWEAELRRANAVARRILPSLVGPPGAADFVLRSDDLASVARALRRLDLAASGPAPMGRERADGVRLDWKLLLPAESWLPFFIEDVTPRALRVPDQPGVRSHLNGASGISSIRLRVDSIADVALAY